MIHAIRAGDRDAKVSPISGLYPFAAHERLHHEQLAMRFAITIETSPRWSACVRGEVTGRTLMSGFGGLIRHFFGIGVFVLAERSRHNLAAIHQQSRGIVAASAMQVDDIRLRAKSASTDGAYQKRRRGTIDLDSLIHSIFGRQRGEGKCLLA